MSFLVSDPGECARGAKIPESVWQVLADPSILTHRPQNAAPLSKHVFSTRKCEAWCGCVPDPAIKASEPRETGGLVHWEAGKSPTVRAHVGKEGNPGITRYLDREGQVGFHSHIVVGGRRYNPPTTTDVILFIQMRAQRHKLRRDAELVFTEEGVYVIHSGTGDPLFKEEKVREKFGD